MNGIKMKKPGHIMGKQGFFYILPWLIGFVCFQIFPMIFSLFASFTKWDILGEPEIIGFMNYMDLFVKDKVFIKSFFNTLLYMFLSNGLGISLAFFLAILLYEKIPGRNVFKIIFFLPNLVLPVALGLLMQPIFGSANYGLVNQVTSLFGVEPVSWLEDPNYAIWVVIFTNFWFIGAATVIFLAGISGHPPSIYEAAEMDGASWWNKLFYITLPMLAPLIFFQVIMGFISGLQIFDIPAALSNLGKATSASMGKQNCLATLVYYLFIKAFHYWEMGSASAIGWIIFLMGMILTIIIIIFMKKSKSIFL